MTRHCQDCGMPVSDDYARVFAADDGIVKACPNCVPLADIKDGAVAGLNHGLRDTDRER